VALDAGQAETAGDAAAGLMVILKALVAVSESASRTRTVKFDVPAAEGVPEISPAGESARPFGRVPDVMAHEYGATPPAATSD